MPPEWAPHERTWMVYPPPNDTFGPSGSAGLLVARRAWTGVATTIVRYEPVTVVAAEPVEIPGVDVLVRPVDDAWARDTGPTFVLEDGALGAVDWVFNGWGAQDWATWEHDATLAADVAARAGAKVHASRLVNEGGALHVDGAGTVLLTETVQLDPARNPGWTRDQVAAEVHARLGTSHAIWLPRGLTRDYERFGTRGHVDMVACFVRPGLVAAHVQPDPAHPDHGVTREIVALLRGSRDAAGRPLEVVEIPAPTTGEVAGLPADYSYLNHYVGNGFVLVGTFGDPRDADALDLLARLYPGRAVEHADGRAIFAFGGGVHCITQQQPALP